MSLTFDLSNFILTNARKPVLPTLFLLVKGTCEELFSRYCSAKKKKAKLLDQSLLGLFIKQDGLCLNYVLTFELKHHYAQLVCWLDRGSPS